MAHTSKNKKLLIAFQGVIIYLAYKDACQKMEENDKNHEDNSFKKTGTFDADEFKFIKSFLLNYLFYSLFFQLWLFYKILSAGWEHLMYFVSGKEQGILLLDKYFRYFFSIFGGGFYTRKIFELYVSELIFIDIGGFSDGHFDI